MRTPFEQFLKDNNEEVERSFYKKPSQMFSVNNKIAITDNSLLFAQVTYLELRV